jgi:SAM-dependent methyltransferase
MIPLPRALIALCYGVVCHLCFAIGVATMVGMMFFGISRTLGALEASWSWLGVDCVVCVDVLEHVADLDEVLDEVRRVLKPGGLFLFDTINRTALAALVIVHFGETMFRLLPRGTHDPAKFIRPSDLRTKLQKHRLALGSLVGLGPRGLNRRLDFTFGRLPSLQIMYMGHALVLVHELASMSPEHRL